MRCVYCKQSSERSRSIEHVVPESLGNRSLLLSPGIVCDKCNNYFSRKVEAPFLNAPWTRMLRHHQGLTSKRGRIPSLRALAPQVGEATMHAPTDDLPARIMFESEEVAQRWLLTRFAGPLVTYEVSTPPTPKMTSRFIAKVAIGCLAERLASVEGGIDYLVEEGNLDQLRDHARRGTDPDWPVSVRRIYHADARWRDGEEEAQTIWELDFFQDPEGYQYVIFVLFGVEFAIHLGEPDISSYRQWLLRNGGASPLYVGRYADDALARDGTFDRGSQRAIVGYQPSL